MKQIIKIGEMVDDGSGDYLRKGGIKINSNFNEAYYELGDGNTFHSAGAWKTIDSSKVTKVNAAFGKSYVINTTTTEVNIQLPKGSVSDYNKVIKVRDVFGTWNINPIHLSPSAGDTIKGSPVARTITSSLADLELVYCSPGLWEYVGNKRVDRLSTSDPSTIMRREYIATEGQTDFKDVFGDDIEYNINSTYVYHRGNLLYYGDKFTNNSDYGSISDKGTITDLDGRSIKLRHPCKAGDTIIFVSYTDGVAQWRSSYNSKNIRLSDSSKSNESTVKGYVLSTDLSALKEIDIDDFGEKKTSEIVNPNSLEVYLNGVLLNHIGTANPMFYCDGADADNESDCIVMGGEWVISNKDYRILYDGDLVSGIRFGVDFNHNDIVSLRWYNNDIGTLLEMEDIISEANTKYVGKGGTINITGGIRFTDFENPTSANVEILNPHQVDVSSVSVIFDLMYPVGHVIENAANPNNPSTYMGFGNWKLFAEKRFTVGWTNDVTDPLFNLNNNDIDVNGNPNPTAGGTGGTRISTLTPDNIPSLKTDDKVLVSDKNGDIIVGGCQFDPDDEGPSYTKYREEQATIVKNNVPPKDINNLPPYITTYKWVRIS